MNPTFDLTKMQLIVPNQLSDIQSGMVLEARSGLQLVVMGTCRNFLIDYSPPMPQEDVVFIHTPGCEFRNQFQKFSFVVANYAVYCEKPAVVVDSSKCTCDVQTLCYSGCRCGFFAKEQSELKS